MDLIEEHFYLAKPQNNGNENFHCHVYRPCLDD